MSLLPIADIDTGERYRKDMGDLPALARSIDTVGLLHPIVVMGQPNASRWLLVAGERRLRACRDILHWERIHVRIVPGTIDLLQAERDENEVREPFTPSEAVAIAAALRPVVEAGARERQGRPGAERSSETDGHTRTDDALAKAVGMGRTTLRAATVVVDAAAADPSLTPIQEAMDESGNVAGALAAVVALPPDPTPEAIEAAAGRVRKPRLTPTTQPPRDPSKPPADATRRIARGHLFEALQSARGNSDLAHPLSDEDRQQVGIHLEYIRWRCLGDAPALREVSHGS